MPTYTVTLTLTEEDLDQLCRGSVSAEIQDALLSAGLIGELLSARIAFALDAGQNHRRAIERKKYRKAARDPIRDVGGVSVPKSPSVDQGAVEQ